jgi:hypothetical protein
MESQIELTHGRSAEPRPAATPYAPASWPDPALLLATYRGYRRHQVRELLALVPRDGLRPLYREAVRSHTDSVDGVKDPLVLISEFAESLLPLPPFRVWCADLLANPEAHLDEPWMAEARPRPSAPLLLGSRVERLGGLLWIVDLLVHHGGEIWRGHLAFRHGDDLCRYRTGDVFREERLAAVGERFLEFDRSTLEAFLRSVQP